MQLNDLNERLLQATAAEDLVAASQCIGQGAQVNYVSPRQDSPLLVPIDTMNVALVQLLLDQGADPNPDPARVYTLPLHAAVDVAVQAFLNEETEAISNETVELLVRYGADFTRKDREGRNAADVALRYNSVARAYFERLPTP